MNRSGLVWGSQSARRDAQRVVTCGGCTLAAAVSIALWFVLCVVLLCHCVTDTKYNKCRGMCSIAYYGSSPSHLTASHAIIEWTDVRWTENEMMIGISWSLFDRVILSRVTEWWKGARHNQGISDNQKPKASVDILETADGSSVGGTRGQCGGRMIRCVLSTRCNGFTRLGLMRRLSTPFILCIIVINLRCR